MARANAQQISVGTLARRDPILARASLDSANIILALAKAPPTARPSVLRSRLSDLAPGIEPEVAKRYRKYAPERGADQGLYDAIRTSLADRVLARGVQKLRMRAAAQDGWVEAGLGDDSDRQVGCMVAGGASTTGGLVSYIPVVGQIAGGVVQIGSQIAGGALDCSREQRQAQAQATAAQAQLAQAQALQNQATASTAAQQQQLRFDLMVGGGILGAVLLAWLIF